MVRAFFKVVLLAVVLVGVAGFALGWWNGRPADWLKRPDGVVGTTGQIDTTKARAAGAKMGEKAAVVAAKAQDALGEASLTAKIKSKMALDDLVRARGIDLHTNNGVVTLTGVVGSEAERQRAVQLARETNGITSVIDRLQVRQP